MFVSVDLLTSLRTMRLGSRKQHHVDENAVAVSGTAKVVNIAHTTTSKPFTCLDCHENVTSKRSHWALCTRKTVRCHYKSLTSDDKIVKVLHRKDGVFTCWRCSHSLKKDQNMQAHAAKCVRVSPNEQCDNRVPERTLAAAGPENNPSQNPPSLKVLVCTIQKLLVPEALCTQIADFLRLLSMVEFWRLRAMSVISNVLVYQEYYKELTDRDDSILPQPITRFKDHEKSGSEWRTVFMKILSICIEVHLRRLWTTGPNAGFWAQWNEYYSPLEKISLDKPSEVSLFHHRLSIEDIGELLSSMGKCKDFVNQGRGAERSTSEEILPMIHESLLELIRSYLSFVRDLIVEVHEGFPTELPSIID